MRILDLVGSLPGQGHPVADAGAKVDDLLRACIVAVRRRQ